MIKLKDILTEKKDLAPSIIADLAKLVKGMVSNPDDVMKALKWLS